MEFKLKQDRITEVHYKINGAKTAILRFDDDGMLCNVFLSESVPDFIKKRTEKNENHIKEKEEEKANKSDERIECLKENSETVKRINEIIASDKKMDGVIKEYRDKITPSREYLDLIADIDLTDSKIKTLWDEIYEIKDTILNNVMEGKDTKENVECLRLKENDLKELVKTKNGLLEKVDDEKNVPMVDNTRVDNIIREKYFKPLYKNMPRKKKDDYGRGID